MASGSSLLIFLCTQNHKNIRMRIKDPESFSSYLYMDLSGSSHNLFYEFNRQQRIERSG